MQRIHFFKIKKLNLTLHRDIGYFLTGMIILYCLSGLALNHIDDWNPDFVISKKTIAVPKELIQVPIGAEQVNAISALSGEQQYTLFDFPTDSILKIYYNNATLLVDIRNGSGSYEKLERRLIFFEANILHKNSIKAWKWAADVFAILLISVNVTGLFIVRGKNGAFGRGKWFILAGLVPPTIAILFFHFIQQ